MLATMFYTATDASTAMYAPTEDAAAREVAVSAASAMNEETPMYGVYPDASASTSTGRASTACVWAWMAWRRTMMHATGLTSYPPPACRTPAGAGRGLDGSCTRQASTVSAWAELTAGVKDIPRSDVGSNAPAGKRESRVLEAAEKHTPSRGELERAIV
jgi:hypothetical protein